ncbi:hypothetical protein C0Q70_18111 [Pomacea canaliculata]|uniref:C1q domain-containing protein n=1 Tax=Pomacea canaliculata TaxID=400727 RepID=A0A2T7NMC1_POMCA|nr:complement C1q-like protein 4 [Pomacea canaliculata]PVD22302.1 hypothetical protein C0Q70_18111 [Pomacea canaliculata]
MTRPGLGFILLLSSLHAVVLGRSIRRSDDLDPLETLVAALSQKINNLQAQLQALETQQQNQHAVSFFAQYSDYHHPNLQENTVLRFDNPISNVGGGYNAATGQFTAPVSGTYVFNLNALSDSKIWFNICIMHNGQCVALTQLTTASSIGVTLELQKGDTVYALKRDGPGVTMYGVNHTTFSGALINAH